MLSKERSYMLGPDKNGFMEGKGNGGHATYDIPEGLVTYHCTIIKLKFLPISEGRRSLWCPIHIRFNKGPHNNQTHDIVPVKSIEMN